MYSNNFLKGICYKFFNLLPDKLFIQLKFLKNFHRFPNLKNPKTFNEKLQWLKLYDHNPYYTKLVDKYEVKSIVADLIGKEYIIPTLGVWDNADDIDFDKLPDKFVLKATHDSGRVIICKNKEKLDKEWAKKEMTKSLKRDFYALTREWPYKDVPRHIIAEEFIEDKSGDLKDYKFFCFNGKIEFFKIDFDRFIRHKANYYNKKWELQPFEEVVCPSDENIKNEKPENFERMIKLAEILAKDLPFSRIDFYNNQGDIYFGEITFFPNSGMGKFNPSDTDTKLGHLITLPKLNKQIDKFICNRKL